MALTACNTVTELNGERYGNVVEVEMAKIAEQLSKNMKQHGHEELKYETTRRFEFDASIQLQSVVCDLALHKAHGGLLTQDGKTHTHLILTKGSPAKVALRCKAETLPDDYTQICRQLAREGKYVLSVAARSLEKTDAKSGTREHLEREATFVGLICFGNELKRDTVETIAKVREAAIKPVMITGDNVYSGTAVAGRAGLYDAESAEEILVLGELNDAAEAAKQALEKSCVMEQAGVRTPLQESSYVFEGVRWSIDARHGVCAETVVQEFLDKSAEEKDFSKKWQFCGFGGSKKLDPLHETIVSVPTSQGVKECKIRFALTQSALETLLAREKEDSALFARSGPSQKAELSTLKSIFSDVVVFGSMTPYGKTQVIDYWQTHYPELVIGMIGDGGNDSCALRRAHVGLSLTNNDVIEDGAEVKVSEVSILSPFSADCSSPLALIELLKEGRSALVNGVSIFQFMIVSAVAVVVWRDYLQANYSWLMDGFCQPCDCLIIPLMVWALGHGAPRASLRKLKDLLARPAVVEESIQLVEDEQNEEQSALLISGKKTVSTGARRRRSLGETDKLRKRVAEEEPEIHPRVPPISSLLFMDIWLFGVVLALLVGVFSFVVCLGRELWSIRVFVQKVFLPKKRVMVSASCWS